jgi:hypothetical protein
MQNLLTKTKALSRLDDVVNFPSEIVTFDLIAHQHFLQIWCTADYQFPETKQELPIQ